MYEGQIIRSTAMYTVVQKNRTTVKSSNSCTEYDGISAIFGLENRQIVFSLQVSNWRVFDETGYQLCLLRGNNLLQQTTLKWIYEEDHILIKSLRKFKGYGPKRLTKEYPTK